MAGQWQGNCQYAHPWVLTDVTSEQAVSWVVSYQLFADAVMQQSGPISCAFDVEHEEVVCWDRGDGERVPLGPGNLGHIQICILPSPTNTHVLQALAQIYMTLSAGRGDDHYCITLVLIVHYCVLS